MKWEVTFNNKAARALAKLPKHVREAVNYLVEYLEDGPLAAHLPGFGRLRQFKGEVYHAHLCKGKPTYVAVWLVVNKKEKKVEIVYVGTHENAPY